MGAAAGKLVGRRKNRSSKKKEDRACENQVSILNDIIMHCSILGDD